MRINNKKNDIKDGEERKLEYEKLEHEESEYEEIENEELEYKVEDDEALDADDLDNDELENGEVNRNVSSKQEITIELPEGVRLDVGLTESVGRSRSFIQSLIAEGKVTVNKGHKKANYKVRAGDKIEVLIPDPQPLSVEPENIPLDIIYEDQDILVVNKPQGMVVHPAPGSWSGTLVNALLYHCQDLSGINGVMRPGIVHRIDKDTSGLLVVAKNDEAHQGLAEQIKAHSMHRRYRAIVHGIIAEPSGTVNAPIGRDPSERKRMAVRFQNSKDATTHYEVLQRFSGFTLIEARLETGRTHQIRVHMAYIKHLVLGDPLYGPKSNLYGLKQQMLHAVSLGFKHPISGEWLEFEAPVPKIFNEVIEKLMFDL